MSTRAQSRVPRPYLPETHRRINPYALHPTRLWRNYKRPLAAPDFLLHTTLGGCCIAVVYTALIGAPDLVLNVLGMGTFAVVIAAIGTIAMSLLHQGSVYDMPIVFLGLSGSASLLFIGFIAVRGFTPLQTQ